MRIFHENKIFIFIIIAAVLVSAGVGISRIGVEKAANSVDIVIDYNEVQKMADQSDSSVSELLSEFKAMKIDLVGLNEENLISLLDAGKPIEAKMLKDIKTDADWKDKYPLAFLNLMETNGQDDYDVVVEAKSKEMYDFISRAFLKRYDASRIITMESIDGGYMFIDGQVEDTLYLATQKYLDTKGEGFTQVNKIAGSKILYLNLGLLPEKVKLIEDIGFGIVPRTVEYRGWNDTRFAKDVIKGYKQLKNVPEYLILAGQGVLGADDGTKIITDYLKQNNITVGIVEATTQRQNISPDGIRDVIEGVDYKTVRVFSVWDYIQNRYQYYNYEGAKEIENSLFRAIIERNIKVIYYKPMKTKDDDQEYITNIDEYKELFSNLERRIEKYGMTFGKAEVEKPFMVSMIAKIAIAIGAVAAAVVALAGIFIISNRTKWLLFGLGAVGVVGAYFIAPNLSAELTSFGAAVMIPCLVIVAFIEETRKLEGRLEQNVSALTIIKYGIGILVVTSLVCLGGALMTAAPISSINYMLELDIFRGVKASQLLPICFFALAYLAYFGFFRDKKVKGKLEPIDIASILGANIRVWVVLLGIVMLGAGYIYLARTGHESGVSATNLEMIIRNYFEDALYARPRTKEFLVAFPAVLLFVYSVVRRFKVLPFIFGTAAVIGFTSIVNTFMHIRTPMELGFVRTGYSVIMGIIIGIMYVLILDFGYLLLRKWGNKTHA